MNQFTPEPHQPLPVIPSWVHRNGFSDWAMAAIWIVLALFLFQITAGIVFAVLIAVTGEMGPGTDFMDVMTSRLDLLFIGNSTGQILFLCLATLLVAKLHLSSEDNLKDFLRLKIESNTAVMVGLTALLFIVVQPIIWYLGFLNSLIPAPDFFAELQQTQYEMIEGFLRSDGAIVLGLLHIALVPAICEEVMFRGYIMRAFENSWGIWPAILISGLVFGLFHIQLTNLIPLATLGVLLALVTWLSGSLLPAIAAHFVNNGSAVILVTLYPEMAMTEMDLETGPPLWALGLSIVFTYLLIRQLFVQAKLTEKNHGNI
jgi:membrane protease YdiL (CAAX protease family)